MDPQPNSAACEGIEERFSVLSLDPIFPANNRFSPIFQLLFSSINHQELEGLRKIRKQVSIENDPPLLELIQTNVLPKLIEMAYSRSKDFIFELCWVLCNIGSGCSKCSQYLLDIKALDFLYNVFDIDPNSFDLQDQIIWTVGNIAGESPAFRNIVIESSIFAKILQYANRFPLGDDNKSNNLVWAMSNLCRGKPPPSSQILKLLDQYFVGFVLKSKTVSMLVDSCWGLSYTTESMEAINHYPTELLRKLIELTNHESPLVATPAIRAIGNLISHTDSIWSRLKDLNLVGYLINLLGHQKTVIRREVIWTLSNMCADCRDAVDALKDSNVFRILLEKIDQEAQGIVREILWTVSNSANTGSDEFRRYLIDIKWHAKLADHFFTAESDRIRMVIVEGLSEICKNNIESLDDGFQDRVQELLDYETENGSLQRKIETFAQYFGDDNDIEMN
jgi:importin subunit alpha-6/7